MDLNCYILTNADQFVNKRDDMLTRIAGDEPDIILISEVIPKSQSNPISPALLHIEGYKPSFNFEPNTPELGASGIRGVAIYSKIMLNANEVEFYIEDSSDHVWIEVPTKDKPLLVGCIYRSPSHDTDKAGCMKSAVITSQIIKSAYERNNNIIIVGDFNYKEIDWESDFAPPNKEHQSHFINTLHECYLFQHVTEPTRF